MYSISGTFAAAALRDFVSILIGGTRVRAVKCVTWRKFGLARVTPQQPELLS